MDISAILALYDQHERRFSDPYNTQREETAHTVRYHVAPHRTGYILYETLTEAEANAIIKAEIAWFRGRAVALEWKTFSHSTPAWLGEKLKAQGFIFDDESALMALELADAPNAIRAPISHDIRQKQPGDDLSDIQKVLDGAFGHDHSRIVAIISDELQTTPDRLSVYVGYADNQPVSCGWIRFPDSPFASIWAGSTLPDFRKRGFYSALLAVRAQEAIRRGYQFLTIDAGDMSRPIVEKHGFRLLSTAISYMYHYEPYEDGSA